MPIFLSEGAPSELAKLMVKRKDKNISAAPPKKAIQKDGVDTLAP